ncbi:MAG: Mitochondrial zinc maintenance protein 1, mitochondrial [Geoglossum simile]|nr:MAG: Mitochondrial zinc maintenance protein 1, mitochondrial [Geoglossum simile]
MALAAYRHLLRSTCIAFRDDARLLIAAKGSARQAFENNRPLPPSSTEALSGIAHAEGVARVLRHNVVQGIRQGESAKSYKLRIHEDIERGDNESIKMAGGAIPATGQCCGAQ